MIVNISLYLLRLVITPFYASTEAFQFLLSVAALYLLNSHNNTSDRSRYWLRLVSWYIV